MQVHALGQNFRADQYPVGIGWLEGVGVEVVYDVPVLRLARIAAEHECLLVHFGADAIGQVSGGLLRLGEDDEFALLQVLL